jgi:glycosyltransferase involved in cell wall biosynthesis
LKSSLCVAICTHNRAQYLSRALKSLEGQDIGTDSFDTLVVDNASSDDTRAVVEAHADVLPNLRYVYEPQIGLSNARNRATEESSREFIAFLDDDAIADPGWVSALLSAFRTNTPAPACIGGRVDLIWEAPRPVWLPEQLLGYLSLVNWSEVTIFVNPFEQYLAGANMAFSMSKLRAVGGFDVRLGRVGRNLISGEELLVQRRLYQKGYAVLYEPRAVVHHHATASRLHRNWFYHRLFAEGVSQAMMERILHSPQMHTDISRALAILLRTVFSPKLLAGLVWPGNGRKSVARRCKALKQVGFAWGHLVGHASGWNGPKGP